MNTPITTSRRAILQGAGATLTLPFLESVAWAAGDESAVAPVRWGSLLFANGVNTEHWWAKGEGESMELSKTLSPLKPFRGSFSYLRGLHVYNNTAGPHWPLFSNYLNGAVFKPTQIPQGAESIDQLIARHVGRETQLPSMTLAVEPAEHGIRGGVPALYYSTISWSSKNTPIPPEVYPRAAFDRLFDTSGILRDRSVLETVLAQSKDLQRNLGGADKAKLDAYMQGVRELELRIERATAEDRLEGWRPSLENPNIARPPADKPQDVREHMRMMLDLFVLAMQMDKTRVVTLLFNRDVSHMQFGFLEGVQNTILHGISHHKKDAEKLDSYQKINQFHVEQFAYLLGKMAAVDEGNDTTLLDNSMLMFGSNMLDGDIHDGRDLPLILAGRGGKKLQSGLNIDYSDRPEPEQRLCNLHLALAQRMGVGIDQFGDSVAPADFGGASPTAIE
ncbi:MAG: DUF1552 domain-containing protein [Verrucomicrobiota bacterium]